MMILRFFKQIKENKLKVEALELNTTTLESKIIKLKENKEELENINTSLRKIDEKNKEELSLLKSKVVSLNEKLQKSQNKEVENNKLLRKIQSFFQMTTEELREQNKEFPVSCNKKDDEWTFTTAFCSIGGCEYGYETFKSEREALINANIKQERGIKVNTGCACSSCYREYMAECE